MGVLDDILGSPPEHFSERELRRAFWASVARIVLLGLAWIWGVPLALLILITFFY